MSAASYPFDLQPTVDRALVELHKCLTGERPAPVNDRRGVTGRQDQICADLTLPWYWRETGPWGLDLTAVMSALVESVPDGMEITDRTGAEAYQAKTFRKTPGHHHQPPVLELPKGVDGAAYAEAAGIGIRAVVAEIIDEANPLARPKRCYDVNLDEMVDAKVVPIIRFDVRIRPKQEATHGIQATG